MYWLGEKNVAIEPMIEARGTAPDMNTRGIDLTAATEAIRSFMSAMNLDEGAHTADTPERVVRAWVRRTAGYGEEPARVLETRFPVEGDPGLVVVSGVRFASTCAHHLLPIEGVATVAYRPDAERSEVVGLSKLVRLLRIYAARLQVQESLGRDTAAAIDRELRPVGAAVALTASHGCMTLRGIDEPNSVTTTLALSGDWSSGHPDVLQIMEEHRRHM